MSKLLTAGYVALCSAGALLAIMFALLFMTMISDTFSSISGYNRCSARGYKDSEVIVHYPTFWRVDTICYDGDAKEGVKL